MWCIPLHPPERAEFLLTTLRHAGMWSDSAPHARRAMVAVAAGQQHRLGRVGCHQVDASAHHLLTKPLATKKLAYANPGMFSQRVPLMLISRQSSL